MRPPFGFSSSELVRALVPDLDRAGAVLALRDLALELRVLDRVVLDVDGEVLLAGLERHALRHRPGRERAVALEAEVVVEPARVVALDDEDRLAASPAASRPSAKGSGRLLRVALAPVLLQAHVGKSCRRPRLGIGRAGQNMICKRPGFSRRSFSASGGSDARGRFLPASSRIRGRGKGCGYWGKLARGKRLLKRKRRGSGNAPACGGEARRRESPSRSSSASRIDSPSSRAASSWSVWAPSGGLGDDRVDDPELEAVGGVGLEGGGRPLRLRRRRARGSRRSPRARSPSRSRSPASAPGRRPRSRSRRPSRPRRSRRRRSGSAAAASRPASARSRRPGRAAPRRRPGTRRGCRRR